MLTIVSFSALVLLVAAQRLTELRLSRRHELTLRALGASEHGRGHYPAMQLLHTAWLVSMLLEVWLRRPLPSLGLSLLAAAAFVSGQLLRFSAMQALGVRWSVRIFTVPGAAPVSHGIFRHLRHPNYLGVTLEMAALPLLHAAWYTAAIFTLANAALLRVRIKAEERALTENGGYRESVCLRPRFWPALRERGAR